MEPLALAYVALLLLVPLVVTVFLPQPYMDEEFHVRQTIAYLWHGKNAPWDPKITTPPGLYAVAVLVCSVLKSNAIVLMRYVSSAPLLACLLVARRPLALASFPLLFFYSALYYTDVWSTLICVAMFSVNNSMLAAAIGLVSLFFRQTNIVWCGLCASFLLFGEHEQVDFKQIFSLKKWKFGVVVPFGLVAVLFASFVVYNGGIALGDRSNHAVTLHLAQLLYFLLFFGLFSAPILLQHLVSGELKLMPKLSLKTLLRTGVELVVISLIVRYGTVVHPFILADNRHYTFYLWRRLLTKQAVIIAYFMAWRWFVQVVDFRLVRTWLYLGAVCAVLVPSPLLEPRYYMVPYLVWRLFLYGRPAATDEVAYNTLLNLVTLAVLCLSATHFMY